MHTLRYSTIYGTCILHHMCVCFNPTHRSCHKWQDRGAGAWPPPTIVDVSLTSCMLPPSLVPILCYNIVFYMLMYVWELGVLEDDVHMLCVHLLQPKSVVHVLYSLTIV